MPMLKRLCFLALLFLMACDRAPQHAEGPQYRSGPPRKDAPVYRLAVHLGYTPEKLTMAYQPLIDHLNRHLHEVRFELEASRDFPTYQARFRAREPEFLLPNPWETLEAMKVGYRVIAMAGDAADFKGIFVVRKDSGLRDVADLKGKVVCYPSPTALAACIMPQYFLHSHGVDVGRDVVNRYVGSQESSIMHAYLKKADAAATWPPSWRLFEKEHPGEAAELKVIWETPPLLNNSVMVRDDVPADVRDRVRRLLIDLAGSPEGRKILAGMETARFHPADNAAYEPVGAFIRRFEREVRPVERQ